MWDASLQYFYCSPPVFSQSCSIQGTIFSQGTLHAKSDLPLFSSHLWISILHSVSLWTQILHLKALWRSQILHRKSVPFLLVESGSCYLNLIPPSSDTIKEKSNSSSLSTLFITAMILWILLIASLSPFISTLETVSLVVLCTKAVLYFDFLMIFFCMYFMWLYLFWD